MFEVLLTVITSTLAAIIAAFLSFYFNRKMQVEAAWRAVKLEYYQELIDAIASLVEGDDADEKHQDFARASNNLLLVASRPLLEAHHSYRDHISLSNQPRDRARDEPLLAGLINAIRTELQMPGGIIRPNEARLWASGRGGKSKSTREN